MKLLADLNQVYGSSKPQEDSNAEMEDVNGNNFKCDQCSFSTTKKQYLKQHQARYF